MKKLNNNKIMSVTRPGIDVETGTEKKSNILATVLKDREEETSSYTQVKKGSKIVNRCL